MWICHKNEVIVLSLENHNFHDVLVCMMQDVFLTNTMCYSEIDIRNSSYEMKEVMTSLHLCLLPIAHERLMEMGCI